MPLMVLAYRKRWFKRIGSYKIFTTLYFAVVMFWGSIFTILVYIYNYDIAVYSIVLFLVAALFIVDPNRSSMLYILNYIIFSAMIYKSIDLMSAANALVFKSLIITVLALITSQSNYYIRKQLFDYKNSLNAVNLQLQNQAEKDSLTQLYNNSYMFNTLKMETEKANKEGGALSLIMLDIDDFKQINDTFGHLVGDDVIRAVSAEIVSCTRESDVVGRYGGEEFIVVLKNTPSEKAIEVAHRIRTGIEGLHFEQDIKVTASFGISYFKSRFSEVQTSELISPSGLVNIADINLYKAKKNGKNCVVF
jgi:diguanylate cyclase (GGDEF)-like protein